MFCLWTKSVSRVGFFLSQFSYVSKPNFLSTVIIVLKNSNRIGEKINKPCTNLAAAVNPRKFPETQAVFEAFICPGAWYAF